jgi:monoamine oxidase
MQCDADVIIIGAGIAGLAAGVALVTAGMKVAVIEARDRVGGRIFTQYDSETSAAIELGAEFIHGLPPEIWEIVQRENIPVYEGQGVNWCVRESKLIRCESLPEVDKILGKMDARKPDESFLQFVDRCCQNASPNAKQWALRYISGFHAADPAQISVHSLVHGMHADEQIEGDRAFRIPTGYETLVKLFHKQLLQGGASIRLNTVVERVEWGNGKVVLTTRENSRESTTVCSRVLITVSLGVLQAPEGEPGHVRFVPEFPAVKQQALAHLAMGKVMRITLRFNERFWDRLSPPGKKSERLSNASFIFSEEDWFPTWWTTMPLKLPIITGWSPSSWAVRLAGQPQSFIVTHALKSLANILGIKSDEIAPQLLNFYLHDWEKDPFCLGAYSYVKVGGDTAQQDLGSPLGNTLFFAGEATDATGHHGTVHGAIASGHRAAHELLSGGGKL